jgi:hypothetical protein
MNGTAIPQAAISNGSVRVAIGQGSFHVAAVDWRPQLEIATVKIEMVD